MVDRKKDSSVQGVLVKDLSIGEFSDVPYIHSVPCIGLRASTGFRIFNSNTPSLLIPPVSFAPSLRKCKKLNTPGVKVLAVDASTGLFATDFRAVFLSLTSLSSSISLKRPCKSVSPLTSCRS